MNLENETPKSILKKYWGHTDFRSQQEQIINSIIIDKNDTLVLLPTGGGKSLCYQIPGLLVEGLCIVVSPLVALIKDQVDALKEKNITAKGLTGYIPFDELIHVLDACEYGNYKFLYISPERLLQEVVLERLQKMKVGLIAIDEAHCISEWGHDFRPKYLELGILKESFPSAPIIALTATAPPKVKKDILENLHLKKAANFQSSYLRKNLSYGVYKTDDIHYLVNRILTKRKGSVIIYVSTRAQTKLWIDYLAKDGFKALPYHGGMDSDTKTKNFEAWKANKVNIIIATNAFGMGIDKADVRAVIHTYIPSSLESYFQEAGRAGRDQKQAFALLLQTPNAIQNVKKKFVLNAPNIEFVKSLYRKLTTNLQIAYGEGQEESYPLNFTNFCERYKFPKGKAFSTLQLLNNQGIIHLSKNYTTTSFAKIEVSPNQFSYQTKHQKIAKIVADCILRGYQGIFTNKTVIDLGKIASEANISQNQVTTIISQWAQSGLMSFEQQNADLEISFLVPREDDITINKVSKYIKSSLAHQKKRLLEVTYYIENQHDCRQKLLLRYFGEHLESNCNNCSNCIKKSKDSKVKIHNNTVEEIKNLLAKQALSSRDILKYIDLSEKQLITILQHMLEEKMIIILPDNTYRTIDR